MNAGQLLGVEAGACVTRIHEVSRIVVVANQQGSEPPACGPRFGPAAHHEFLLAKNLQLAPVVGPFSGVIERVDAPGDRALPSLFERTVVQGAAIAGHHLAQAKNRRAGTAKNPLEPRTSRRQRKLAEVVAAIAQRIEGDERAPPGCRSTVRLGEMYPALQLLKPRGFAFLVERDDFAIEHDGAFQLLCIAGERSHEVGKLPGLFVAEPRPQAYRRPAVWSDFNNGANAVVLGLV